MARAKCLDKYGEEQCSFVISWLEKPNGTTLCGPLFGQLSPNMLKLAYSSPKDHIMHCLLLSFLLLRRMSPITYYIQLLKYKNGFENTV